MNAVFCETSVIIMHTYKIRVTESARVNLVDAMRCGQTVILSEKNSDTCYFIVPAHETEKFLNAVSAFHTTAEKISISELREKYSEKKYFTLFGDLELVATLFQ